MGEKNSGRCASGDTLSSSEWHDGWRALTVNSIGYGTGVAIFSMTAGLFVKPMAADLGWSTKAVSILPIVLFINVLGLPIVGLLLHKWGSRRVGILGHILLSVALFCMAIVPADPTSFFLVVLFFGLAAPLTTSPTYSKCIATWFDRHLGTALGITLNGASFLAVLTVPLTSGIIHLYGWRAGFLCLASVTLIIGTTTLFLWFREREDAHVSMNVVQDGHSFSEAAREPSFWMLMLGVCLGGVPLGGFLTHLQAMLADAGISISIATSVGLILILSITVGRVGGGFLLDRFQDGAVALILMLLSAFGAVLLAYLSLSPTMWLLAIAVFLVGIGQGAESDFGCYFALRLFGMRAYSRLVSIYGMAAGFGFSIGGFGFAALRDELGNYQLASLTGALCFAAGGILILGARVVGSRLSRVLSGSK